MDKYGVLHEYRCECGYTVIMGDAQFHITEEHIKQAGTFEPGHIHRLVQVEESANVEQTESR